MHEPLLVPIDFQFDLDNRTGSVRAGDGALETEVDTLRGIDPPDPYRVIVKIPNGFEYMNEDESAETALSKVIRSKTPIDLDIENGHSSMAYVRHGTGFQTGAHPVGT